MILAGCTTPREEPEDPSAWFAEGEALDVMEPVEFTDEPYGDFGAPNDIADLYTSVFPTGDSEYTNDIVYGPDEYIPNNDCEYGTDNDLPMVVEGIVTVHPRFYIKTSGCDWGDEKYYGSYFLQDNTGGLFILGDSKVAHFEMGDRVRLRVRGARTSYELNMVYAHDVESIDRGPYPIYYQEPDGPLGPEHVAKVQRVRGTVTTELGSFGELQIENDDGTFDISVDSELSRRGFDVPIGTDITVTGPVIYSYSTYSIIIMRRGQVQVHDG